jgi:hypothetical protein
MTSSSEPLAIAVIVAKELERLGIPYLLGGSLASTVHGEPRATLDIDFVVHMTPEQAGRLASALERDFYVGGEALIEAATTQRMANVMHKRPYLKIDFHVRAPVGHYREEMRRALRVQVGDTAEEALRVAAPEDVVLQKLRWYRLGGEVSDRQWRDVLGVLKRQAGALDGAHLERWSQELGVVDLLARALEESRGG